MKLGNLKTLLSSEVTLVAESYLSGNNILNTLGLNLKYSLSSLVGQFLLSKSPHSSSPPSTFVKAPLGHLLENKLASEGKGTL